MPVIRQVSIARAESLRLGPQPQGPHHRSASRDAGTGAEGGEELSLSGDCGDRQRDGGMRVSSGSRNAQRAMTEAEVEHGRFDYSPIARRPVLKMPKDARVAVWITPNVEHYHWNKPAIALTQMTTSLKPDVLNYAWRDYGARVGIWRIMEILEKNGFVATAALNAEVCEQYPDIIKEGNRLGWEWMAHGPNNSMIFKIGR